MRPLRRRSDAWVFTSMEQGPKIDTSLLLITLVLVGLGTVMVYSSSCVIAQVKFKDSSFFLERQILRALAGLAAMVVVARINYRVWTKGARIFLLLGLLLLLAVLVQKLIGVNGVRGARRWLIGGSFQPSEFVKLALVCYLADSLARKKNRLQEFRRGYVPYVLVLVLVLSLIVAQPDLGTALAIGTIAAIMLFIGGVKITHLLGTAFAVLPIFCILISRVGYWWIRIESFLNRDSYQITQSLLGLGNGGLSGVGLGESKQKLFFLPDPHTDFVFSITGEELGFIGAAFVVLLFLLFARRGIRIAKAAPDLQGFFLAVGITVMISVYATLNIGVVTGVLPTTGLPLPFISYGGSSLFLTLTGMGMLLSISRQGIGR